MASLLNVTEAEILNQRLAHGNHPVLQMCMRNAVVVRDAAGNRKLDKSQSIGRIDAAVALVMALGSALSVVEVQDLGKELERAILERGGFA